MRSSLEVAVIALLIAGVPAIVAGHQTDRADHHTEVRTETGEVEQMLSIPARDLAQHLGYVAHGETPTDEQLDDARGEFAAHIDDHTGVRADGEPCELREARFIPSPGADGRIHRHQLWQCDPESREVEMANRVMFDGHDGYRHVAQIQVGDEIYPTVFDPEYPTYAVYPGDSNGEDTTTGDAGSDGAERGGSDRGDVPEFVWILALLIGCAGVVGAGFAVVRTWKKKLS